MVGMATVYVDPLSAGGLQHLQLLLTPWVLHSFPGRGWSRPAPTPHLTDKEGRDPGLHPRVAWSSPFWNSRLLWLCHFTGP